MVSGSSYETTFRLDLRESSTCYKQEKVIISLQSLPALAVSYFDSLPSDSELRLCGVVGLDTWLETVLSTRTQRGIRTFFIDVNSIQA